MAIMHSLINVVMFLGASDSGSPPKPQFSVGMKLEAVDRRFPYFVCVATIMDRTGTWV